MRGMKRAAFVLGSVAMLGAGPAHAALLGYVETAQKTLSQYNLVVYGDVDSTSEAEGRTYIGGNLNGQSSNWNIRDVKGGNGLTVFGNVTGNPKSAKGNVVIGGNAETYINNAASISVGGSSIKQNGSYVEGQNAALPTFASDLVTQRNSITSSLSKFSAVLATLSATTTTASYDGKGGFKATGGSNVINITTADLNSLVNANLTFSNAGTTIINVSGKNLSLASSLNFNGGEAIADKVIWNFYEADSINFGSQKWYGTVLAPKASSQNGNYVMGSAVFASLTSRGEFHIPSGTSNFTGDLSGFTPLQAAVPEPASWAMMVAGFGLVGGAMRRRSPIARAAI